MQPIDSSRQRYLDLIHRYLQGRLAFRHFRHVFISRWAEERDAHWLSAWESTRTERCMEHELQVNGKALPSLPADPRRYCRMLDRLSVHCLQAGKEAPLRAKVEELLAAYRQPEHTGGEARYVAYPPNIPIFERPLPGGKKHRYPCTVNEIRRQLALVPEYDLEGLWAIGLWPCDFYHSDAYATYFRRHYPERKPMIVVWSDAGGLQFKLRRRCDPGYVERWFHVEAEYDIQMDNSGARTVCRWSKEDLSRYLVEHVLLHEIGHHVQYQQRQRSKLARRLPSNLQEQFAEDYAIRFNRQRKARLDMA